MSEPLILCDNLVKIFKLLDDVEVLALQGLDLSVQRGEMVGVVGASGSGKSTLLNVLGGLVRPTAGKVIVHGQQLLKLSNRALNRYRQDQVGFVWQQSTRNLIHYLSAVENVEYPMIMAGHASRRSRERARELLDLVGLSERLNHRPAMLSGGEQQRVAIAIALANEPTLLLADEPTGELDSVTSARVYQLLKQLNRELNLTTLIVSHDPGIARHVDRVIAIRDGKLAGETRRNRAALADLPERPEELSLEEHFEELTVLDSAGRLQIPQPMREELKIGSRVTLERLDDGVLIRPVVDDETPARVSGRPGAAAPAPEQRTSRWRSFWKRDQ
ncbi:MAG: ATP-binding cassette domain-containing protein [Anaerolineales bacterium]|nr:ATP-binding cassette domain-containing protein [Anaerolineales bacterium]MCB0031913.1 ATP-binding cassette domain-containing protein [Anaerolineales bacterium]